MTKKSLSFLFISCILIFSCQNNPYKITNKSYKKQAKAFGKTLSNPNYNPAINSKDWVGTTNFNMRKPNMVIIHHTAQNSCEQTLKTFTLPRTSVSAHYVICKDGTVHHMLNDYLRAWHAGTGKWGSVTDINSNSIGIEIDNNGFEEFTEQQMNSLENILAKLKANYNIPQSNFIGHADIAPTRKNDPNINFDWKRISDKGFGLWYGDTSKVEIPVDFKPLLAFKMIGYDISDSSATIKTFKRKFLKDEQNAKLEIKDLKVLFAVWNQSMKQ